MTVRRFTGNLDSGLSSDAVGALALFTAIQRWPDALQRDLAFF